jgi:hypothetical protein
MHRLRKNRGLAGLALMAILALVFSVAVAPVGSASSGGAQTAKKKCGKKKHGSAGAAKKKKCKKKKKKAPAPVVRATLTWTEAGSSDADLDLFVFAADGKVAGNGGDTIPLTTLSPDVFGVAGRETFTDNAPKPPRTFSFGVCYEVGGSVHAPFTITYVTADGVSHTDSQNPGSSFHYNYPGGPTIPAGYCPH